MSDSTYTPQSSNKTLNRICGISAVRATFICRPDDIIRLFYTEDVRNSLGSACSYLARNKRPYREVSADELKRVAGTQHHGGVCAVTIKRVATSLGNGPLPSQLRSARLIPILDGIGNPHNLGAIARSAAFFGCKDIILSDNERQADLSDAAFRIAEGGLEHLNVWRHANFAEFAQKMRSEWCTVAAVAAGGMAPEALPRDKPLALVLGNEETGLPHATLEACETRVTLPGCGRVESLNVGAAAAVLIYALAPK